MRWPACDARRAYALTACVLAAGTVACYGSQSPGEQQNPPASRVAKAVIIIHGVGNQTVGYSRPLQEALGGEQKTLHFIEVLWSDLGSLFRQGPIDKEQEAAERAWLAELEAAERQTLAARDPLQPEAQLRKEYADARGFVGPIVRYEFLSAAERGSIQQRLRDALDWASKNADDTFVVAHSLGSVIAFDALHGWEGAAPSARVALMSTMGSPLNKPVFAGHRGRPSTRPAAVASWVNYHSPHDPIASALAGAYANVEDRRVQTTILPLSAHTAYWTHQDVVGGLRDRLR